MFLVKIEPANKAGYDLRTFGCLSCSCAETITVKFEANGA
jgi:hypothetical protein